MVRDGQIHSSGKKHNGKVGGAASSVIVNEIGIQESDKDFGSKLDFDTTEVFSVPHVTPIAKETGLRSGYSYVQISF